MVVRWRDDETRPVVVEMSEVGIRDLDRVLVWLMDSEQPFMLGLSAGNVDDDLGLPDPEVDELLREALSLGLLRGDRSDYGTVVRWARLELTPAGLRHCREWPPRGQEHHPGPWDGRDWGRTAIPILRRVRDGGYRGDLLSGLHTAASQEQWRETLAAHALWESGYLDGKQQPHRGISSLRLTRSGREALDPRPRSHIDEASLKLKTSTTSAVVHAVEVALGERLRALAREHGIVDDDRDVHRHLSGLNDELTGKRGPQVYAKHWKKTVEAVLAVRNEYAHGRGDVLPHMTAAWVISTVQHLLEVLPVPGSDSFEIGPTSIDPPLT